MHHVARGREPKKLKAIRSNLTPRWVEFYERQTGEKPTDTRWREFQPHLSSVFLHVCGYCEECCKGDVDHFRPKSRFPRNVYRWSNWVLACPVCNNSKAEHWPQVGLVDPCGGSGFGNCEPYFTFDTKTCEVLPAGWISDVRRRRAQATIEYLSLNSYHHLKKRTQWLTTVRLAIEGMTGHKRDAFVVYVSSRERELSSITRQLLGELGLFINGRQ